jgi:type IV secretion system protein VirD4
VVTNHKIKEIVLFILLAIDAFLSYKIATFGNSDGLGALYNGYSNTFDTSFFVKAGISFVVLGVISTIVVLMIANRFSKSRRTNSSALLNWKQIKAEQRGLASDYLIPKNDPKFKDGTALLLTQNVKLLPDKVFHHTMVVASTGSGKSASILIPQLQALNGRVSAVVTDPKAELHKKTYKMLEAKGFNVKLLKLDKPEVSVKYNLLANCRNVDDVRKLAESILGNDEWGMLSQPLLSAFLFRQYFLGGTLSDVVKDLAESPQDIYELGLEYFHKDEVDKYSRMAFEQFQKVSSAGNAVGSIFLTIQGKMRVFEFDNIREISSSNDFKVKSLRNEKTVLFISYPEEESRTYEPFLASFYFQLFNILKGDDSVQEGADREVEEGLPIYFLMDEFANVGRIPAMDNLISTIRSKKMGIEIFLQNIEQLKINYGNDVAKTIVSNCKTRMTMAGSSEESAEFFSKICGEQEVEKTSVSYGGKGSVSYSSSKQKERVISANEITRMKDYDALIVTANLRPVKDDKNYYYMDKVDFWFFKNTRFSNETKQKLARRVKKLIGYKK